MGAGGFRTAVGVAALLAGLAAGPAAAQQTRAEAIALEKARKAERLRPYEPGKAERVVTRIGEALVELPRGLFPAFGSIYPGGGLALGPAVRVFHGDTSFIEGKALLSVRQYKRLELTSVWPALARGRVSARVDAGWLDAPQVGFFGLGIDSARSAGVNFRMQETYGGGELRVRAAGPLVFGGALAIERYETSDGRGRRPPIGQRFTPAMAPGLDAEPRFTHAAVSAAIDTRPAAGYARRGTLLQADYHAYRDRDEVHSFGRVDATAIQHVPFFRESAVLSLRGRAEMTTSDEDRVPFFLLPSLGSGSTLRAYSTGRFRDRHALLLQAEWRWIVNRSGMDMALFYDAGTVAGRARDLGLDRLKGNVGLGLRFHGPATTPVRIELARGREGFNLVFAGGATF